MDVFEKLKSKYGSDAAVCRMLQVSPRTYLDWKHRQSTAKERKERQYIGKMLQIIADCECNHPAESGQR